jgi:3-oxoacyl-[acyl-carrier-protein] synthase II
MDVATLRLFESPPRRRVVVTGVGVVSPIGCTADEFWDGLVERRSGISALADADSAAGPACGGKIHQFTGHIDNFGPLPDDLRKQIRKSLKVMNRETQLAVAAAQQALRDSRLTPEQIDPQRTGVSFGAGYVGIQPEDFRPGVEKCRDAAGAPSLADWGEKGLPEVHPLWLLTCLPNMPGCYIAMYNGLQGPNNTITLGDGAANLAMNEAAHLIREGDADIMIAGGCGNHLDSCSLLHALLDTDIAEGSADPAGILRPYDRDRRGALPAEAGAVFILEELQSARGRGAVIYGEVLGGGSSCVVQQRAPQRTQAITNAICLALNSADCDPRDIDHIQAHGLSSRRVDADEAAAIAGVFGTPAMQPPVTTAKGHCGDAGAGSGAIELAAGLLALQRERLFPVMNYQFAAPDCPLNIVRDADHAAGDTFLKINVTPQGQATALVIRRAA